MSGRKVQGRFSFPVPELTPGNGTNVGLLILLRIQEPRNSGILNYSESLAKLPTAKLNPKSKNTLVFPTLCFGITRGKKEKIEGI